MFATSPAVWRDDIDTWCVYIKADGCWQGATDPGDMSDASDYLDRRSHTRLFTCGNTLWPTKKCRNRASDAIKRSGGQETPAVIGISLAGGPHYALAYGYKQRKLKGCFGETWWTQREFYVNQGWGGGRGWVNAYFVWFAGEIRPYAPPQTNLVDDVALYRTSDHRWYYDYGHSGDTNAVGGAWGVQAGDLPLAGDFDRDGFVDDVVFFLPDWEPTSIWFYDYGHNGPANDASEWGWEDGLPLAGAFGGDQDP